MAKQNLKLPSYYDGNVLNRRRELEFHASQAMPLNGQAFDIAVNHLMNMTEEYELSALRSTEDPELPKLADYGQELLRPLLAKQRAHKTSSKDE